MARKYLRGLQYLTGTNGRDIPIFMKICYEFWGYCVNGGASLNTPGGMPTTPTNGPVDFFEGTSVLATGNDGVTSDLGINFTSMSANFTPGTFLGKYIVIWSHTDPNSTDNSIYRIIGVPNSKQLQLAPFSGGTVDISTLKNNLRSRSALNYRVIDVVAASQTAIASGNYFVGSLSGASTVNPGQASSQFQFLLRGSPQSFGQFGIVGSPNASWNGSAFVSAVGTSNATLTERTTASTTNFTGTTTGVNGYITLIADKDFFMGHIRSPNTNATGLYFYITVPQRLYTQAQDPNPLAIMVGGNQLTSAVATDSHSTSFGMVGFDGITRTCQLITKNFIGDGITGPTYTIGPNLGIFLATQTRTNQIIYSEALISSTGAAGQFSLCRAKMRPMAFTSSNVPIYHLVGDIGEYIHMGNGVLWPWDGAILPYTILPLGA